MMTSVSPRATAQTVRYLLSACLLIASLQGCAPSTESNAPAGGEGTAESSSDSSSLVVYSGRSKSLLGPLLERFEEASGIKVEVRYGGTAELAATLLEEGVASPADVFIAQDAAALGAVSEKGLLKPVPAQLLARVDSRFSSAQGDWVGLSGRARTVVYNTEKIAVEDLPRSLEQTADSRYRGRFGVAPANASFQAHMALYRAVRGTEALDELLGAMTANEPQRYPKNSAIVEAVIRGEVDWGLVNHYYLWRALQENPEAPAKNFWLPEGEASSFLNLAGVGAISGSDAAFELVSFLLSDEAQTYFAAETFEYPLVAGIEPAVGLVPLDELLAAQVDFPAVAGALAAAQDSIVSSGLLQ